MQTALSQRFKAFESWGEIQPPSLSDSTEHGSQWLNVPETPEAQEGRVRVPVEDVELRWFPAALTAAGGPCVF